MPYQLSVLAISSPSTLHPSTKSHHVPVLRVAHQSTHCIAPPTIPSLSLSSHPLHNPSSLPPRRHHLTERKICDTHTRPGGASTFCDTSLWSSPRPKPITKPGRWRWRGREREEIDLELTHPSPPKKPPPPKPRGLFLPFPCEKWCPDSAWHEQKQTRMSKRSNIRDTLVGFGSSIPAASVARPHHVTAIVACAVPCCPCSCFSVGKLPDLVRMLSSTTGYRAR